MENPTLSKQSVSFGLSLAVTAVINSLIVVVKEKSDAVMAGMKQVTGHHWTTHTLLVLVLFVFIAWMFGRTNQGQGPSMTAAKLIQTLVSGIVLAGLIIVGFYLFID